MSNLSRLSLVRVWGVLLLSWFRRLRVAAGCPHPRMRDTHTPANRPQGGLQKPSKGDELVKVEFMTEPGVESGVIASDLSGVSTASEQCMLKCTPGDALLDALNDPSVLELFPAGNLDGAIDEFQVTGQRFWRPPCSFLKADVIAHLWTRQLLCGLLTAGRLP